MEKSSEEILILDSLKIGYISGRKRELLLPPLSATAGRGEIIAVIGRNGIGKSTLLRTLTGLQPSLDGSITCSGKNIREYSRIELAMKVGYISTETIKVGNMRVYDLVALGRFPHTNWIGRIDNADHKIIQDAIEKTGMSPLSNRFVAELSDGERQKAMIARILAQDTDIMVMDEPTAFLDVSSKYEIFHLMHLLSRKNKKTIIFSTHDLDMAVSQSDKIWLILGNRLIEGAPEDLMITREFDQLFDSSSVHFDSDRGTFSFRSEETGKIYIEGEGALKYWTEKAVNRVGISVSESKTVPYIKVSDEENNKWQVIGKDNVTEFRTIYDMIMSLNKQT